MKDLKTKIQRVTYALAPFLVFAMALSATKRWF
jgi:hypothetical protein